MHYLYMDCESIRAAISAGLDGEDPGIAIGTVDSHLAGCGDCRDWQQRAHVLTRRFRLGGHSLGHDLAPLVLAALPAQRDRGWRRLARRAGLAVVAVAQLAVTLPLLVLGHDHGTGLHAAHELGSFDLALAIAFAVGAARPGLSAGLAWPCGIAALGLACTAASDVMAGAAIGADEAQHLVAVAGAALLFWQARRDGAPRSGHAEPIRPGGPQPARLRPARGAEPLAAPPALRVPHPLPRSLRAG